ncbi:MAG: hypothetical protein KatS3mg054_0357 [Chloroflexus sp.]|nr:MAG: hypothetical protein KatS3mg054_0357 [Chloroflexus sp.]
MLTTTVNERSQPLTLESEKTVVKGTAYVVDKDGNELGYIEIEGSMPMAVDMLQVFFERAHKAMPAAVRGAYLLEYEGVYSGRAILRN